MRTAPTETSKSIRQRAEEKALLDGVTVSKPLSLAEAQKLVHELRVHQIELEMQNEELQRNQATEAAEALVVSEWNYRTLADSGQALIWTARTDKLCDYFNKVWLDFTGRTDEQEFGNGWLEGVHPDDLPHCLDTYVAAFDRREAFSMDYRLRRHDGEYRWIQDDGCPRYDGKGNFIGYIGYCLDITDLKNAENELHKLIKNQESLIADKTNQLTEAQRIAHIGSWELDNAKNAWIWSDEVFRIYGLEISELPVNFEHFLQHVHSEDRQMVHTTFTTSLTKCTPYHTRHRIIRKADNETRFVSVQCNHICNSAGLVTSSIGTVQDITKLVAKENDLKEYAHHIVKMIESERTRIARELHDELGQNLTLLSFAINQLKHDHLARRKVMLSLPDMQSGVDQMMESIRRITAVENGAALLEALQREQFDVVLSDISMPDMDGVEVVRIIRSGQRDGINSRVPMIALTAHAFAEDRALFMGYGFNDTASKPVDFEGLLRQIDELCCEAGE